MGAPFWNSLLRSFAIGPILTAAIVGTPAHAERWKELIIKPGVTYRIDLDTVEWQGRIVKYRSDVVDNWQGRVRHGAGTALINCETGERKLLESEQYRSDGSVSKNDYPNLSWQPIKPWSLSEAPRRFLCLNEE